MSNSELIFPVILLVFIAVREWQQQKLINKLIDKLMSRNYYDYKVSEAVAETNNSKIEASQLKQRLQTIDEQQEFQQDMGSLTGLV